MSSFFQEGPQLENTFSNDRTLVDYLQARFAGKDQQSIFDHLQHCGHLAAGDWWQWAEHAENNQPLHIPYDAWGKRIDEIQVSEAWQKLEKASVVEGIVASGYQSKYGDLSRLYQMSLLYLFHSSSAFVSCPLAMSDGAAYCLQKFAGGHSYLNDVFRRLTSTDPNQRWLSGQWMTEKIGGSDVSQTQTRAEISGHQAKLFGIKWFTSATTAQVALTLARDEDSQKNTVAGSKGLSLYLVQMRDEQQRLQGIVVNRLKNKLGTKAMPTAELTLEGAPAHVVGGFGEGVKKITSMLNITRIYNSVCATSHARRALDLAISYSQKREAFGKKIAVHPMHQATLQSLEESFQKCFHLTFYVVELLGKDEHRTITQDEVILLRLLTPLMKLYTARQAMQITSEVVESFGGVGYIENSRLPALLRDAQVFSIWEGTTNVLCLDFFRAVMKDQLWPNLMNAVKQADQKINIVYKDRSLFNQSYQQLRRAIDLLLAMESEIVNDDLMQTHGRQICFSLTEVFAFLTIHKFLTAHPLS